MALVKLLAQESDLSINSGTSETPNWVHIGGVTEISISPSKTDVDTTDFDSDEWNTHLVARRGASWTVSGHRLEDKDDGSRDPGQEEVETYQNAVGSDSIAQFQYTTPGGKTYTFEGSVNVTPFGGSNDAIQTWSFELTMQGALVTA